MELANDTGGKAKKENRTPMGESHDGGNWTRNSRKDARFKVSPFKWILDRVSRKGRANRE